MDRKLFREKSIERISSPEQLDDYIRVCDPGAWLLLAAVAVLLLGILVWGLFGRIDTKLQTQALVQNGMAVCCVSDGDGDRVKAGMPVLLEGREYPVLSVSEPVQIGVAADEYYLHVSGISVGDWVCLIQTEAPVPDGVYPAQIVVDRVRPALFAVG